MAQGPGRDGGVDAGADDDRPGALGRTLRGMGLFALVVVSVFLIRRFGLLDGGPTGLQLVVLLVVATAVVVGLSVYRGEHRRERKYPLGTGLSRDTPDPSDYEDGDGDGDEESADGDGSPRR